MSYSDDCPESVSGHNESGKGTCRWCGTRFGKVSPKPKVREQTDLGQEYRRHYDPDYGDDVRDT